MAYQAGPPAENSFLEIPLELRIRIYTYVFHASRIYVQTIGDRFDDQRLHIRGSNVGIILTCRQTLEEARCEWYESYIYCLGHPPALRPLLCWTKPSRLAQIRYLCIQIYDLPDFDSGLLPALKELVVDLSTDLSTTSARQDWCDRDDQYIYDVFAVEAFQKEHSTFRELITSLYRQSRSFGLIILVNHPRLPFKPSKDIFVNLDTKAVERLPSLTHVSKPQAVYMKWEDVQPIDCLKPSDSAAEDMDLVEHGLRPDQGSELGLFLRPMRRSVVPPGRDRPDRDDEDERGSIRDSEREPDSDDSGDEKPKANASLTIWETTRRRYAFFLEASSDVEEAEKEEQTETSDASSNEEEEEEEEEDEDVGRLDNNDEGHEDTAEHRGREGAFGRAEKFLHSLPPAP